MQLRTVNKAIKLSWPTADIELVKGEGYFYFEGTSVEHCFGTSVMVYRLNDLTLDRWLAEASDHLEESKRKHADNVLALEGSVFARANNLSEKDK